MNTTIAPTQELIDIAVNSLQRSIDTHETNLFISGGSSFYIFRALDAKLSDREKQLIHIFQIDERYGEPSHINSNWSLTEGMRLSAYGSCNPVLSGASMQNTVRAYQALVAGALKPGNNNVAILGYGADSHIAGIKPMDMDQFNATFGGALVSGYEWTDYSRITLTPEALSQFDTLVLYGYGPEKRTVIDSLQLDMPAHASPVHTLKNHESAHVLYAENKEES